MRRHITFSLGLVLTMLSGCGGRQDLGGKATLVLCGDGDGATYSLYVFVNGEALGQVGKLGGDKTQEFTFENAKNGKNELRLVTTTLLDRNEETFSFTALPGGVTRARLSIGFRGFGIKAALSTDREGIDPAKAATERAQAAAEKQRKENAEAEERARKAKTAAELDVELYKFAKEFVPDLQQAIDRYEEQIKQFTEQRSAFAREMAKHAIDPETRPAYRRKKELIDQMTSDVKQMLADRRETFIRWKELSLLRDSPETLEQRKQLLQNAQRAARNASDTFDKYMKQSEDAGSK